MKRVLVVEDDGEIRRLLADLIAHEGYVVDQARQGNEALATMARHRPDVIILDLMMPVMDGWSFVETLRNRTHWSQTPIVVISAVPRIEVEGKRLGVSAWLPKPFDLDELVGHVRRLAPGRQP